MTSYAPTRARVGLAQFEAMWSEMSHALGRRFNMSRRERRWLKNKPVARLIAAIPIMAGCVDAERTAIAHVGTYLLSLKQTKEYFNASSADDSGIFARLRLGMNFHGGDESIIDKGMSMLALCMLTDYERDRDVDRTLGKYNPVASGAFDFEATREELEHRIAAIECPELDSIWEDYEVRDAFWGEQGGNEMWGIE